MNQRPDYTRTASPRSDCSLNYAAKAIPCLRWNTIPYCRSIGLGGGDKGARVSGYAVRCADRYYWAALFDYLQ
ncbi:MAG: hypothetical protein LKI28_05190 [Ancrocorticia sp.]|nr:hypothetical protein [Ancrocorticia sp.]